MGDAEVRVASIAPLDRARGDQLSFCGSLKYGPLMAESAAGVVLVSTQTAALPSPAASRIVVGNPHDALLSLIPRFYRLPERTPGIHPSAVLGRGVQLGAEPSIGPHVVIGEGAVIGDRVTVDANTVVGARAVLGDDVHLYPSVTVYANARLGKRVIAHSGVRIGSDGFGYVFREGRHEKIPHVGGCIIEDDVEIGANSTIDRGSIDDTVVGAGTKIDNLVQIGHNVRIGRLCLLMSQVGVAGSVRIEDGVHHRRTGGHFGPSHDRQGRHAWRRRRGCSVTSRRGKPGRAIRPGRTRKRSAPRRRCSSWPGCCGGSNGCWHARRATHEAAHDRASGVGGGSRTASGRRLPADLPAGAEWPGDRLRPGGPAGAPDDSGDRRYGRPDGPANADRRGSGLGPYRGARAGGRRGVRHRRPDDRVGSGPSRRSWTAARRRSSMRWWRRGSRISRGSPSIGSCEEPVRMVDGESVYEAYPADALELDVTIDFPHPLIGRQRWVSGVDEQVFAAELAPARTFGFTREVETLRAHGADSWGVDAERSGARRVGGAGERAAVAGRIRAAQGDGLRRRSGAGWGAGARPRGGREAEPSRNRAIRARDARGAEEGEDRAGDRRHHEGAAAPVSVPARGSHSGDRAAEADRGDEERHDQRAVLPGTLSRASDHAGGADHRGHGAGGRHAADGRGAESGEQGRVLHVAGQREMAPAGATRRPAALRAGHAADARADVQDERRGEGGRRDRGARREMGAMVRDR